MKHKRSIAAVTITLALVLSVSAFALSQPGTQVDAATDSASPLSNVTLLSAENTVSVETPFTDVQADAWYAEAVAYCYDNGLIIGTSDTEFSPNTELSRAMVVTILHRAAGEPAVTGTASFTDTQSGEWYSDAVAWSEQNGIVAGYGNGLFGTNDPVTREQLAVILWRYDGSKTATTTPSYADNSETSSWAANAVAWANEANIANTRDGNRYAPRSNASRAETAYMFKQLLSPSDTPATGEASTVFMTTDISSEGLMAIYEALGADVSGNVAVKVHTGEPGGQNYLRPEFMQALVQSVDGTIVESNTAYGGSRASTAMHYQLVEDHGFTAIAPVVILDEEGSLPIPVENGTHFSENLVGARLADFDYLITLSHFKGHAIGGYGGAIKNMSIGIASTAGKNRIHTAGTSDTQWMGGDQDEFTESMAEATKAVVDFFDGKVLYINVMNRMSVDCDCSGAMAAEPEVHDIGILASFDPVALDQACIDLIYAVDDGTADSLIARIEGRNGTHAIDHGEAIGLGSKTYTIVSID